MINGTFFVQIINFFFGYLILKHLFLKPGLRLVQGQRMRALELNKNIVKLSKAIAEQQDEQEKVWRQVYKKICAKKPHVTSAVSCNAESFVENHVEMSSAEEQELIEQVKNTILDHVCRES